MPSGVPVAYRGKKTMDWLRGGNALAQVVLDLPDNVSPHEARLYLAIKLYEVGKLSLGRAASMAGYSYEEFITVLGKHGVSILGYDANDLEEGVKGD